MYQHTRHLTQHSGQSSQEGWLLENTTHNTVRGYEGTNAGSDVKHSLYVAMKVRMPVVMSSIHVAQHIVVVQRFDHKGLCQARKAQNAETVLVPNEDLCGWHVVHLQSTVLRTRMLDINTAVQAVATSLYHVI